MNRRLAKRGKVPRRMRATVVRPKKLHAEFDWEGRPVKAWHMAADTRKSWDLEPEMDLEMD